LSEIHGVGEVAMRGIKKGETMHLNAILHAFDLLYSKFNKLRTEVAQLIIEKYPLVLKGSHFFYPDTQMSAYLNHSDKPNYDGVKDKALRKIEAGEEIVEDYRKIQGYKKIYPWLK